MSTAVWKFELTYGANKISMPQHARVLSCAFQGDKLMVWAVVVESNMNVERAFYVTGTGHSCKHELRGPFVGTAFVGALVFHVFDHGEVNVPDTSHQRQEK